MSISATPASPKRKYPIAAVKVLTVWKEPIHITSKPETKLLLVLLNDHKGFGLNWLIEHDSDVMLV